MKAKLCKHFGDRLTQTAISGKLNVVTFKATARIVLQEYYNKQPQEKRHY